MLIEYDIGLARRVIKDTSKDIKDTSEDILQRYGAKQKELYVKVEKELKEIHRSIQVIRIVPIVPSSTEMAELGDKQTQLRRPAYATEAQIQ
jgi:hypothetical protein